MVIEELNSKKTRRLILRGGTRVYECRAHLVDALGSAPDPLANFGAFETVPTQHQVVKRAIWRARLKTNGYGISRSVS